MYLKKFTALALAGVLSLSLLTACGDKNPGDTMDPDPGTSRGDITQELNAYLDDAAIPDGMQPVTSVANATFCIPAFVQEDSIDYLTYMFAIMASSMGETTEEVDELMTKYGVLEGNDGYMAMNMTDFMTAIVAVTEDDGTFDVDSITPEELGVLLSDEMQESNEDSAVVEVSEIAARDDSKVVAALNYSAAGEDGTSVEATGHAAIAVKDGYTVIGLFLAAENDGWTLTAARSVAIDTANVGVDYTMEEAMGLGIDLEIADGDEQDQIGISHPSMPIGGDALPEGEAPHGEPHPSDSGADIGEGSVDHSGPDSNAD